VKLITSVPRCSKLIPVGLKLSTLFFNNATPNQHRNERAMYKRSPQMWMSTENFRMFEKTKSIITIENIRLKIIGTCRRCSFEHFFKEYFNKTS